MHLGSFDLLGDRRKVLRRQGVEGVGWWKCERASRASPKSFVHIQGIAPSLREASMKVARLAVSLTSRKARRIRPFRRTESVRPFSRRDGGGWLSVGPGAGALRRSTASTRAIDPSLSLGRLGGHAVSVLDENPMLPCVGRQGPS